MRLRGKQLRFYPFDKIDRFDRLGLMNGFYPFDKIDRKELLYEPH